MTMYFKRFGLLHYAYTCKRGLLKESIDRNQSHLARIKKHELIPAQEELIRMNERIKDHEEFIRYTIQWYVIEYSACLLVMHTAAIRVKSTNWYLGYSI